MKLTKSGLVDGVVRSVHLKPRKKRRRQLFLFPELDYTPLTRTRANQLVASLLEIMKETLEHGEAIQIRGFGTFQARFSWPRRGRNPRDGKAITIPSRVRVVFRSSKSFKRKINGPKAGNEE